MSEFNSCLRSGKVTFGDDLCSVAEVTHLFGAKATKLPYRIWFNVPGKDDTIVCMLTENGGDGWSNMRKIGPTCDKRGWNEILGIDEFNKDPEKTSARIEDELARPLTRYVFWHEEREGVRWYKFYGTFLIDADATRATLESENPRVVYCRVSNMAECLKVEEVKTVFTDDEFKALQGKMVEFDFCADLATVADEQNGSHTTVTVMPGMRFAVEKTDNQFAYFAGNVEFGDGTCLLVPRRDFELGYLHVLS